MRIRVSTMYYWALFLWSMSMTISMASLKSDVVDVTFITTLIWSVVRCCIVFKLLFEMRYCEKRDILVLVAICMVGYFSCKYSESNWFIPVFWFIAGGKGVDWKKAVKFILVAQIISMVIIVLGFLLGFFPDNFKTGYISGKMKESIGHSLGYYHPNDFAGNILQIFLMRLFLMERMPKLYVPVLYITAAGVMYSITRSGTSASLMLLVALLLVVLYLFNNRSKVGLFVINNMAIILRMSIGIIALGSIIIIIDPNLGESVLGDFHSRITQIAAYFAYYKITPWGQPLINHTSIDYDWRTNLYTLDNSYAHLLLGFGWVLFVFFVFLYMKLIKKAYKEKNYISLIIFGIYAVLGFTETMFIRAQYNFTIFLLAQIIWNENSDSELQ